MMSVKQMGPLLCQRKHLQVNMKRGMMLYKSQAKHAVFHCGKQWTIKRSTNYPVFWSRWRRMMVFSKNVLVVLLVLSTITLCLAKPRWIWRDEEDENDGEWNDEVFKRRMKPRKNQNREKGEKVNCNQLTNPPSCHGQFYWNVYVLIS